MKTMPEKFVTDFGDYVLTKIMVCHSAAGYYIGRMAWDKKDCFEEPGSRESDYFETAQEASLAMRSGWELRECNENDYAYMKGAPIPISKQLRH